MVKTQERNWSSSPAKDPMPRKAPRHTSLVRSSGSAAPWMRRYPQIDGASDRYSRS